MRIAKVRTRPSNDEVAISITVDDQLEVPEDLLTKWQEILNLIAELMEVPVSLIMKLEEEEISVFLASKTEGNPYQVGDQEIYGYGLYCETVVGTRKDLMVSDAKNDSVWFDNPDASLGMISYLGFPLVWPSGEIFGTICVLDNKKNEYNRKFIELIRLYKKSIENDLHIMVEQQILQQEVAGAITAKSNFIANLNHELRNPLNGVLGITELLINTKLDEEQLLFVKSIQSSGKLLMKLISQILDVSKLDSGNRKIELEVIILREFINEIIAIHILSANEKGIYLKNNISEKMPKAIKTDAMALRQILFNLIGNAIKFTSDGGVELTVEMGDTFNREQSLKISVSDTGIGMKSEDIETIFERFTQLENVYTKKKQGLGIGLYLVRELVEMLKGDIQTESAIGSGTKISLMIPVELSEDSRSFAEENDTKKQGSVLYIEDDVTNQLFVKYMLKNNGYEVDILNNGIEAVDKILSKDYDVVLMDINMPGRDGIEVIEEVRRKEKEQLIQPSTRIIAVTAFTQPHELKVVLSHGFDAIIMKPFTGEILIDQVKAVCSLERDIK